MNKDSILEELAGGRWGLPREHSHAHRNRILTQAAFRPILERLTVEGERFLETPIPDLPWTLFRRVWEDGNRKTYEPVFFQRRQRLTAFGLLSWLWPEREDYRDGLLDTVWAICNEFSWCIPAGFSSLPGSQPVHMSVREEEAEMVDPAIEIDLFAAETAFALAEVMAWTGQSWPEAVRSRIYRETYRRIFRPFLHGGPYFWEAVRNNWAAVCAGSIGAAAIHLMEDPQELALILNKAMPTLDLFLEGYGEDGACLEGYMYWGYGFGFYTYFAELLHLRTAGAVDLLTNPKVKQLALFQQKCFLTGRKVVNFSDCPAEFDVYIGLTHEMARRFPEMHVPEHTFENKAIYDHCGRWAPALRNLIWYDAGNPGRGWEEASYYLPDAQWLVSRVVKPEASYCFAAKGGHNDEPHNHNDVGHFILSAGEDTFLADMGCGLYSKQYFEPSSRYSFICNSALGHSVPIIDGIGQHAGSASRADVLQADIAPEQDRFGLELKEAYALSGLQKLERQWTWQKDGPSPRLQLEDLFVFSAGVHTVTERFICAMQPAVKGPGHVELEGRQYKLVLLFDGANLDPTVEPLSFMNHFGKEELFYALDLNGRGLEGGFTHRMRFEFRFEKRGS